MGYIEKTFTALIKTNVFPAHLSKINLCLSY